MVTDTLDVGVFPIDIAILPDGQHAVVPNAFSDPVSVIDIPSRTVLAEIPITGSQPYRVEVCSSNNNLVAVGVIDDAVTSYSSVSIIDVSTLTEVASIPTVSQGAFGAFFTPEVGIFGYMLKPVTQDQLRVNISVAWSRFLDFADKNQQIAALRERLEPPRED